jgi:hypothetical protein
MRMNVEKKKKKKIMKQLLVLLFLGCVLATSTYGFLSPATVTKAVSGGMTTGVQGSSDLRTSAEATDDSNFFELLYAKLADVMAPSSASANGKPSQVFLMEVPGLAIAREDFDTAYWQANDFRRRQPAAVFAELVDRAPRYWDVTFVDSGATVSKIWENLMRQYMVPALESDVQRLRKDEARALLENGTLSEDFFDALEEYEVALDASLAARTQCLTQYASSPEICSQRLKIDQLRVRSRWFDMETRRRDLESAQATLLALQVADLKVIFADALQNFERNRRVDVGAESYGATFQQTFATPSNWWQWWELTTTDYDAVVAAGDTEVTARWDELPGNADLVALIDGATALPGAPVLTRAPDNGELLELSDTQFRYLANDGFAGADSFRIAMSNATGAAEIVVTLGVTGPAVSAADTAFVSVSMTSAESSSTSATAYSSLSVSARSRVSFGFFSSGGASSFSSSSYANQFTSSTSTSSISFEIAKVAISRPWLDPTLLSYKPVGVRGTSPGAWSDGRGLPSTDTSLLFPLLPTGFIVARNVELTSDSWSSMAEQLSAVSSKRERAGYGVQLGPFFAGSSRISGRRDSSHTYTTSTFTDSNALSIGGPLIIGWTCVPLPFFPTASSQDIEQRNLGYVATTVADTN